MTRQSVNIGLALAWAMAFALMAVLVQTGRTTAFDAAGLQWAATLRGPAITPIALVTTLIGSGTFLIPIGLLVTIGLQRKRGKRVAWTYLGTVLLGWAVYGLLKAAFARPRPDLIPRLSGAGWWSFPSGHAMSSTIVLGLAAILFTGSAWIRIGAALLILLIAFSRVYLGVHYPSDVIAGVLAGCAGISASLAILGAEPALAAEPAGPPSPG